MLLQPEIHLYIQQNICETISEQKFLLKKDFWNPSVLVWHGQNCDRSQIGTKRVGAWPLCFFFMVTYIFDVFNFSFAKYGRKKIWTVPLILQFNICHYEKNIAVKLPPFWSSSENCRNFGHVTLTRWGFKSLLSRNFGSEIFWECLKNILLDI